MAYLYEEPTKPPRGPEVTTLEATRRRNVRAQLHRHQIPDYEKSEVPYRLMIEESRKKPLGPYSSPTSEGLANLVNETITGE
jgi:hypothetical protein